MSYLSYAKPFNNNLLMLLLRDHKRYMPIVEFFESMTMDLSEIRWLEAELIAAEISKANRSDFCTGMREGMTKALKASPLLILNPNLVFHPTAVSTRMPTCCLCPFLRSRDVLPTTRNRKL